ncbi:MAG TPA: cytochrome c [Anaeromyxobacteraceae bacterium]|nr:cytochrome c [Anaeromyxobacteraceae bacterium]
MFPRTAVLLALAFPLALALAACERPPPATRGVPPSARTEVGAWLAGATPDGAPTAPRPAVDRGLLALGAEVYRLRCVPCHGVNGNGRGLHAGRLSVPARDFTRGVYEFRSTPTGTLPTDLDLFRTVSRGVHGTAMIPWGWLGEAERWAVVEHVKSFSPRFREDGAGDPVAVPAPPPETPELVQRGAEAWARNGCAKCHGETGEGDGPSSATLRRDGGEPVRAMPFSAGRFLRGGSMADLWLTLSTGLDGTPMPSYAAVPSDDLWALAAWVRARAGISGGARALPPHPEERLGWQIDVEER